MIKQQKYTAKTILRNNLLFSWVTPQNFMLKVLLFFSLYFVNTNILLAHKSQKNVDDFVLEVFSAFKKSNKSELLKLFKTPEESFYVYKKQGVSIKLESIKESHMTVSVKHLASLNRFFEDCRDKKIDPSKSTYVKHDVFLREKSNVQIADLLIKAKCGMIDFTLRVFDCEKAKGRWTIIRAPNLKRVYDADSSFNDFPITLINTLKNKDKKAYIELNSMVSNSKTVIMESNYEEYEKAMLLERIMEDSISNQAGKDYDSLVAIFSNNNFDLNKATITIDEANKFTTKGLEKGRFSCLLTFNSKRCRIESKIDCIKTPDGWKIMGIPNVYIGD